MIFWTVEGEYFEPPNHTPLHSFTWFLTEAEASAFVASLEWKAPPEVMAQRMPKSPRKIVDFLNHFAGA